MLAGEGCCWQLLVGAALAGLGRKGMEARTTVRPNHLRLEDWWSIPNTLSLSPNPHS